MEALVPAFVAALLCQFGDRSAMLAAVFADRYNRPLTVALAALIAHGAGNGLAAFGGSLLQPILTPNASALFLALALLIAALGAFMPVRAPNRLEGWRLGALLTPLLGIFILALGDATQFFTLAFAARGPSPWMAAGGATLGAFAVNAAAAYLGEKGWATLPFRRVRAGAGLLFLLAGVVIGLGALRLV